MNLAEETGVIGQGAIWEDSHLSLEVLDADPLGYRNIQGEHCRLELQRIDGGSFVLTRSE
jgi:hypothetical protein